ncbi:heavy metal translocating P-type ATPase [Alloscardovia venturai]|uniref:Heavy metal translocating P-type ATPase n=1 Tax=Alloscardovia venturai TaxID=1769421 RepID=A0ABW2Y6R8_9BIFI
MSQFMQFLARYKKILLAVMTVFLALAVIGSITKVTWLSVAGYITVTVIGGVGLVLKAVSALRYKVVSIELLVSIAVIGALIIGEFSEAGIVVWLFSLGDVLEELTLAKTRESIKDLTNLAPQTALKVNDPSSRDAVEIDVDDIEPGDYVLVKSGANVPVDGVVSDGQGYVDEASITGESKPATKELNSHVYAGTTLTNGTLVVKAETVGEDTTFGKLIELVEEAQDSQTKEQRFIDSFSKYYTPIVLLLGLMVGIITRDVKLAITVLVLGCPGALVIGVPVATVAGIGRMAWQGIVAKGASVLEALSRADTFIFDKTGTITTGKPQVVRSVNVYGGEIYNRQLLASAESESDHPLATAIVEWANPYQREEDNHNELTPMPLLPVRDVQTFRGKGISAHIADHQVLVGNERLLDENDIVHGELELGKTTSHVLMAVDGKLSYALEIADTLKEDTPQALEKIRKTNKNTRFILLSGDAQSTAEDVVKDLDFGEVHGDLLPQDKEAWVHSLKSSLKGKGHKVVFVGDGINDGPALATADVGIAMGSGTDVAINISDIVLTRSELSQLATAYTFSKKVMAVMYQNIAIALATVILLIIGLFVGYIHMASGMFIHEISILIVIANAMRFVRRKNPKN